MQKMKKLWQNKFIRNYLVLLLAFIFLEMIFRVISNLTIFSYIGLRIFLILNIIALIISFMLSFFAQRISRFLIPIIVLIATIYGIAELGFKNFIGVYASVSASTQAEAVTSYIFDFIKSFQLSFYLIFFPFILVLIYYTFLDKKITLDLPKKKRKITLTKRIIEVVVIVSFIFSFFSTLKLNFMQTKNQAVKSYELFLKPNNPSLVVNDFGYIGFGLLDIKEYFWPGPDVSHEIDFNPLDLATNNTKEEETEIKPQITIDNAIWIKIIENEKNSTKNNLNKYFIGNTNSNTNEYTGLLANKNLIMIMVESGSELMINSDYYPNISKLYEEGWSFNNYYSPRNTCSTGNNEFSNLTGLYTIYNNCTANIYSNNTYFTSLFNLFKKEGYDITSYHDHVDQYYSRAKIHQGLGVNDYYNVNRLGIKWGSNYGDWASDEDLMNAYLKILDERDKSPFVSFITTVTSHSPYIDSYQYNNKYKNDFPSDLPSDIRGYMSKLKVVDNAIGILIDGLEERNILEDTVIVLFADHYPYAISKNNLTKAYGYDVEKDNDAERVPFIIYNPSLEAKKINTYTEHVNTTPTLANLFDLSFDSRLYLGSDVLDNNYESIVIFDDGSWKNEYAYYDASKNKASYYTQKVYSDEEILAINEKISLKLKMSSQAIKSNYFNYLENLLTDYDKKEE